MSSQLALSRNLDVGRTPLREALRLLQSEGLVAGEPNRRVRVAELSARDLEDLYILRILLETAAVRLTIPSLNSADLAEMRGFMAQMDHYGSDRDWAGLRIPHKAFHMKFVAEAGPRMVKLISDLFDQGERYRLAHIALTEEQWAGRQIEHGALVDAAVERDPDLTAEILTKHYMRTAALVMSTMEPERELTRLRSTVESVSV
jgi:DNA-binding GntR family transcriptional regulator